MAKDQAVSKKLPAKQGEYEVGNKKPPKQAAPVGFKVDVNTGQNA